jgi:hypothetical protein
MLLFCQSPAMPPTAMPVILLAASKPNKRLVASGAAIHGRRLDLPPRDPQNGVAVALARPAHHPEPVDPDLLQPDGALAPLVVVGLDGHRAERERPTAQLSATNRRIRQALPCACLSNKLIDRFLNRPSRLNKHCANTKLPRWQLGGCNRGYVGGWLKRDGVPSVSGSRTISFTLRSRSAYLHRKTGPTCSQLICSLGT